MPSITRNPALLLALCLGLAACAPAINVGSLSDPVATSARQSAIELVVKLHFDDIIRDIEAGGGPELDHVLIVAQVPKSERDTRILQLRRDLELYRASPGALITALALFGA